VLLPSGPLGFVSSCDQGQLRLLLPISPGLQCRPLYIAKHDTQESQSLFHFIFYTQSLPLGAMPYVTHFIHDICAFYFRCLDSESSHLNALTIPLEVWLDGIAEPCLEPSQGFERDRSLVFPAVRTFTENKYDTHYASVTALPPLHEVYLQSTLLEFYLCASRV
jgi:hypothetical protein